MQQMSMKEAKDIRVHRLMMIDGNEKKITVLKFQVPSSLPPLPFFFSNSFIWFRGGGLYFLFSRLLLLFLVFECLFRLCFEEVGSRVGR